MNQVAIIILMSLFSSVVMSERSRANDILRPYEDPLSPAKGLRSSDGRFWVNMQGDENLVVYGKNSVPCWGSDTMRDPEHNRNADPRLFLTASELSIWTRDPRTQRYSRKKVLANRGSGANFIKLVMQNDGNLVLYQGEESHGTSWEKPVFATGEAKHKACKY